MHPNTSIKVVEQQPLLMPSMSAKSLSPAACSDRIMRHLNSSGAVSLRNGHGGAACLLNRLNACSPSLQISIEQHHPQWLQGCFGNGFRLSMVFRLVMLYPPSDARGWVFVRYAGVELPNLKGAIQYLVIPRTQSLPA